jgi:F-type H+-transporting ATPase subunit delta
MPTDRALKKKESVVYAEVLLDATLPRGVAFEVSGQLEQMSGIIRGNVELRSALTDRSLPEQTRCAIVREVFNEGFDDALVAVLEVMVKRDDVALLGKVSEAYLERAEDALNAVFVDVWTVVALDDGLRESIRSKFSGQSGRDVRLREHIDGGMVGGIVLSSHGRRIDASVASQLKSARVVLAQSQKDN